MGSRNPDGTRILQPDMRLHSLGNIVQKTSHSGVLSTAIPNTDTSIEKNTFSEDTTPSGMLAWHITRQISSIQTSVSKIRAKDNAAPSNTSTERKIFYIASDTDKTSGFADWNIFDATGEAVGAGRGTTDTDITPSGTWNERPHPE